MEQRKLFPRPTGACVTGKAIDTHLLRIFPLYKRIAKTQFSKYKFHQNVIPFVSKLTLIFMYFSKARERSLWMTLPTLRAQTGATSTVAGEWRAAPNTICKGIRLLWLPAGNWFLPNCGWNAENDFNQRYLSGRNLFQRYISSIYLCLLCVQFLKNLNYFLILSKIPKFSTYI